MSMMTTGVNLANTLKYKKRDTLASDIVDDSSPIKSPSGRLHHKSLKAAFAAFKHGMSPNSAREISESSSPSLYQDSRRPSRTFGVIKE